MSAKGLSGKTSFIPEYLTIHKFLMNVNRDYVSLDLNFVLFVYFYSSLPASFSRSYSTFPLCSGTTLIEQDPGSGRINSCQAVYRK